ncbi:MAG: PEP/pyruvate-binding domain-containing protein [Armatimonadota bacterium]
MQHTSNFNIVVPLDQIEDPRSCGSKAVTLARLLRLGFHVPGGFCLGADAYRTHLWAAGVRTLARGIPDAETRESLRSAIIEHDLPPDVFCALKDAYASMGEDVKVAVRHSASDDGIAGKSYETALDVQGLQPLIDAVKRVWASLWSDQAAELREKLSEQTEPTMGVLIQPMVDIRSSGVVVAANPLAGNPNEVHIRSTWGIHIDSSPADLAVVDLKDFSITHSSIAQKETIQKITPEGIRPGPSTAEMAQSSSILPAEIVELAELAVWVDTSLGGPHMIQWAHDGSRFIIFEAQPIGRHRPYFSASWHDRKEALLVWRLLSNGPAPVLINSLPVFHRKSILTLPSAKKHLAVRCQAGRPYKRVIYPWETPSRWSAFLDVIAGARLHRKWKSAADRAVKGCWSDLSRPVQKLSKPELVSSTRRAINRVDSSAQWSQSISYSSARFAHLIKGMLLSSGAGPTVLPRLLQGQDPPWLERDMAIQRLAAYVKQSKEDEDAIDAPQEIARDLSKQLGYVFEDMRDQYDPSSWQSWVENPNRAVQLAEALARGPLLDTELAYRKSAAIARVSEDVALAAIRSSRSKLKWPLSRMKFRMLLHRVRSSVAAASAAEQVHALALSVLRTRLIELGNRLKETKILTAAEDVFYLTVDEVSSLKFNIDDAALKSIAHLIAERKHSVWLETRLNAPEWLPLGAGPRLDEPPSTAGRILTGKPIRSGEAIGQARVARSLDDAMELQPGEVLVVKEISPAWTPLLSLASGLVLLQGDHLSIGSIAARNYGIPCVSEIPGVTSAIQTGQTLRVDGSGGTVEIVKRRS